jgi:hypothetical protein
MDPRIQWETTPSLCSACIETKLGPVNIRRGHFQGGTSQGVEVVVIDTGALSIAVLPTRGMGIWKMQAGGLEFGWKSPVPGPVHPAFVPVSASGGLGWLEGFDELLVRCGLHSNGAAELNEAGVVNFPLHGRIANTPASRLWVEIDESTGQVTLAGEVVEAQFLIKRLRLISRVSVFAGSDTVQIIDEVTNDLSTPNTAQLLYHINIGAPMLSEGAELLATPAWFEPKDELSRSEANVWAKVGPPQERFHERVYFTKLQSDSKHKAMACLRSADGEAGFGLRYDTSTLPYFTFWRNTAATSDGYVVGLEPATNLPNTRTEETAAGREVSLAPRQSVTFRLELSALVGRTKVEAFCARLPNKP